MILTPLVSLILGVILAAAEGVQLSAIHMSTQAHDAISVVIQLLVGVGILPATKAQIVAKVPIVVVTLATAALGAFQIIQTSSFSISSFWHVVIAVVLVIGNTLGITATNVLNGKGGATRNIFGPVALSALLILGALLLL